MARCSFHSLLALALVLVAIAAGFSFSFSHAAHAAGAPAHVTVGPASHGGSEAELPKATAMLCCSGWQLPGDVQAEMAVPLAADAHLPRRPRRLHALAIAPEPYPPKL